MSLKLLVLLAMLPAADVEVGRLAVRESNLVYGSDGGEFAALLDVDLGSTVVAALHNGVPIILAWQLQLKEPGMLAPTLWQDAGRIRLSYRALSRHYWLVDTGAGRERSYPALAPVIAELADLKLTVPPAPGPVPDVVEAHFRIRLDIGKLPPPLRLPAYLNAAWRLDSRWVVVSQQRGAGAAVR